MGALQGYDSDAMAGLELQAVVARMRQSCDLGWQVHGLNYGNGLMPELIFAGGNRVLTCKKRGLMHPFFTLNCALSNECPRATVNILGLSLMSAERSIPRVLVVIFELARAMASGSQTGWMQPVALLHPPGPAAPVRCQANPRC